MTARALWWVGVALAATGCETCENDVEIPDSGLDADLGRAPDARPVDAAPGLDGGDGDAAIADAGADAAIADAAPPDAAPNSLCSDPVSVFNGSFEVPELAPGAEELATNVFAWTLDTVVVQLVRPASGLDQVEPFAYPGHFSQALRFESGEAAIRTTLAVDVGQAYRLKFALARPLGTPEGGGLQVRIGTTAATTVTVAAPTAAGTWHVYDTVTHTAEAAQIGLSFRYLSPTELGRRLLIDSVCLEPI